MKKKATSILSLTLLYFMAIAALPLSESAPILPVIRILPDGSLEPPIDSIQRQGDVYVFDADVYARLVVDRDNVVIDGAGYDLHGNYNGTRTDSWEVGQGPYQDYDAGAIPWSIGIDLSNQDRHNLTVRDLNVKNFYIGLYVWTSNNTVTRCSVSDNIVGILLSGDSNTITQNYITRNEEGVFFGVNQPGNEPLDITLVHNSFVGNTVHFSGCFCEVYNTSEPVHTWDDGKEGNYWDNYNGTDSNGDGFGDTVYTIDVQNQDRYPLMQSKATPPVPTPGIEAETVVAIIALSTITTAMIMVYRRRRKTRQETLTERNLTN